SWWLDDRGHLSITVSRRHIRGRSVFSSYPPGHGMVHPAPSRLDERNDPVDGTVGTSKHRLCRYRAADRYWPGSLRHLGLASAIRYWCATISWLADLLWSPGHSCAGISSADQSCSPKTRYAATRAGRCDHRVVGTNFLAGLSAHDGLMVA